MSEPCAACDYTDNGWCPCECHVEQLIEESSLGTPAAKAARDSVSEEDAQRIVDRADPCHPNPQCRALAESKGEDL